MMKQHNDHSPFMYFAVTFFVCGLFTLVWYLMSNGL